MIIKSPRLHARAQKLATSGRILLKSAMLFVGLYDVARGMASLNKNDVSVVFHCIWNHFQLKRLRLVIKAIPKRYVAGCTHIQDALITWLVGLLHRHRDTLQEVYLKLSIDALRTDTGNLLHRLDEYTLILETLTMWHAYEHSMNEDLRRSAHQGRQQLRHYLRT